MTKGRSDIPKSGRVGYRVFEFFTEAIGWLQILASPLLLGLVIGAIIYFTSPNTTRLILAIVVSAAGLIFGIIWATKQWKGKGTNWFMSRIMATPELDSLGEGKNPKQTDRTDQKGGNTYN